MIIEDWRVESSAEMFLDKKKDELTKDIIIIRTSWRENRVGNRKRKHESSIENEIEMVKKRKIEMELDSQLSLQ